MSQFPSLNRNRFYYPGQEIGKDRSHRSAARIKAEEPSRKALDISRTRMFVAVSLFSMIFAVIGGRLVHVMAWDDLGLGEDGWLARSAQAAAAKTDADTAPPKITIIIPSDTEAADADADTTAQPEADTDTVTAQTDTVPAASGSFAGLRMARADIIDRNGSLLATNLPTMDLYADTRNIPRYDLERAVDALPRLFPDLKPEKLRKQLSSGRAFIYLRRNLTPREQQAVNDLGVPGLNFQRNERRVYPPGRLVSHVLGATNVDNKGIAGIEAQFDERLRSSADPLRVSLDLRAQHVVHRVLRESIDYFQANAGVGLVADVRTGELVALVSLPDYEPERYASAADETTFNQATLGVYELGSVFKIINTAMGLKSGLTLADGFDATHPIRISRFTINDFHGKGRWLDLTEILVYSSNIASAKLAMAIGADGQRQFLRELGMLDILPLEVPERARPLSPSVWRDVSTMTVSYGHGISVTPVHMVNAVGSLVNGGIRIPPTLLPRSEADAQALGERVISADDSRLLRGMMREVVVEGSGKQANVKGYFVGGKTGSAEKDKAGGYSRHDLRTTFVAAFPMTDPEYAVLVMLDSPKGLKETYGFRTAGWNAAPTAGRIIAELAPILGVKPLTEPYPDLLSVEDATAARAPMPGQGSGTPFDAATLSTPVNHHADR